MPTKPDIKTKFTVQEIANQSFDTDFGVSVSENVGYDGINLQKKTADNLATKITVVGAVTYIGLAAPGTPQSSALWQCKKIDESSGTVITWADGDANWDNIATDLTALTYT